MTLQLSGWLGATESTNVPALAGKLGEEFLDRRGEHNEDPILIPVVGILRVESARLLRDPDAEPVVAVKLAALEAAHGTTSAARHATAVRELWQRLRDDRLGTEALPLDWSVDKPAAAAPGEGERYDHGSDDDDDPGEAPGVATTPPPAPPASFSDAQAKRGGKRS